MMEDTLAQWRSLGPRADLWVFGYASLVWRPEFEAAEQRWPACTATTAA
jgi:glutathione-specific gamma-glutamylcyclotransferase